MQTKIRKANRRNEIWPKHQVSMQRRNFMGGRSDLGTVLCATIRRYDHAAKRVRLDAIAFATLRGESSDIEHFSFS